MVLKVDNKSSVDFIRVWVLRYINKAVLSTRAEGTKLSRQWSLYPFLYLSTIQEEKEHVNMRFTRNLGQFAFKST